MAACGKKVEHIQIIIFLYDKNKITIPGNNERSEGVIDPFFHRNAAHQRALLCCFDQRRGFLK